MTSHERWQSLPFSRRHPCRGLVSSTRRAPLWPGRESIHRALTSGFSIHVCSISIVELVYLVDKGRVQREVADRVDWVLRDRTSGFRIAPLDRLVAEATRRISRSEVPDLPDRVIAATALAMGLPLVTRDGKIRAANKL